MSADCVQLGGEQFVPHCSPAMILSPFLLAAVVVFASAVTGCPVLCTCRSQAVDCSGLRLFSVPLDLPLDTRNLSLAHNHLTSIPPGYLTCYLELRVLDLRNNSLVELPVGLFLTHNPWLKKIDPQAFRGLAQLRALDLSYGALSFLSLEALEGLTGLVTLQIGGNPIPDDVVVTWSHAEVVEK
uniref:Leucine rich repeat containing 55 n=1 Tax=Laticauda laticaudata TaxID=8630 RepID=A0A8C5RL62_LATLA